MLTPADWAGLCALAETSRPDEQEYVLWVIRNRVESPRFPDTYERVILQPKQFSAFNAFTSSKVLLAGPLRIFNEKATEYAAAALLAAVHLAENVLAASLGQDLLLPTRADQNGWLWTCHYYSPVSMKPPGSAPAWAKSAKRLFTPPGIDPQRFVFAEGVP